MDTLPPDPAADQSPIPTLAVMAALGAPPSDRPRLEALGSLTRVTTTAPIDSHAAHVSLIVIGQLPTALDPHLIVPVGELTRWAGYHLEALGLWGPAPGLPLPVPDLPPVSIWSLGWGARGPTLHLHVWRLRAWYQDTSLYAELSCGLGWSLHVRTGGYSLDRRLTGDEQAHVNDALDLLRYVRRHALGRPSRDRDAARRKLRQAADKLGPFEDRWDLAEKITELALARAAIKTVRTIGNWKQRAEWDIDAIRADAYDRHLAKADH